MSVKLSPWPKIGEQMIKATPTSEPSYHRLPIHFTRATLIFAFQKNVRLLQFSLPRSWSTTQISWISGRIETLNYCTHTFNGIFFCDHTSCSSKKRSFHIDRMKQIYHSDGWPRYEFLLVNELPPFHTLCK